MEVIHSPCQRCKTLCFLYKLRCGGGCRSGWMWQKEGQETWLAGSQDGVQHSSCALTVTNPLSYTIMTAKCVVSVIYFRYFTFWLKKAHSREDLWMPTTAAFIPGKRESLEELHWPKFSAGVVFLQKVPAKGVVLNFSKAQEIFLRVLETLEISDWSDAFWALFLAAGSCRL